MDIEEAPESTSELTTSTTTTGVIPTSSASLITYSNDLLSKLNKMRQDPKMYDYQIICNDKILNVHKFILIAISDYFRVMLTESTMKESRENRVELKGFQNSIGLEALINYAYTGQLQITFDNLIILLDAACHLQIKNAINLCSSFLIKNCLKSNCVNILKIADRFALKDVEIHINEFIFKNFVNIYEEANEQFLQMTHEQLVAQLKSDTFDVCSELDLFLMVCKWINYDRDSRLIHAYNIMQHIRFMIINPYDLVDHVETVDFMQQIPELQKYLTDAYRYHSVPLRQPLIYNEQTRLRTKTRLVAVGETNIFVLNENKNKWEIICNAPLEDNYPYPFAAITINNYLYVLGTRKSASEEYLTCYRFSPLTLEWTQLASLLHDRSRFGAAVVDNYIYIFGGFEGFKRSNRVYLNTIDRYSIERNQWEEFSSDGPQMSSMAACTYNDLIYFGGGKNIKWNKVSDFYCLNVNNKNIERKSNMLTARTTHQITVYNTSIIVIGGFDDAGNGILSIEQYNIEHDQWSILTNIPGSISKTWPQSLGVINSKFYISIFHTPNTFKIMQKAYYYDLITNIWSEAPVAHDKSRYCPTCQLTFPNHILNSNENYYKYINHDQVKSITDSHLDNINDDDHDEFSLKQIDDVDLPSTPSACLLTASLLETSFNETNTPNCQN